MKIKFNHPTTYVSHSILGDGSKTVEENCDAAKRAARRIRKVFPEVKFYLPGESNLVLHLLWDKGLVEVEDILHCDCEILRACHNWCWLYSGKSTGCQRELEEAKRCGLVKEQNPNYHDAENIIENDLLKASFSEIRRLFSPIVEVAIKRFRKDISWQQ